jgi:hypothetical protein
MGRRIYQLSARAFRGGRRQSGRVAFSITVSVDLILSRLTTADGCKRRSGCAFESLHDAQKSRPYERLRPLLGSCKFSVLL